MVRDRRQPDGSSDGLDGQHPIAEIAEDRTYMISGIPCHRRAKATALRSAEQGSVVLLDMRMEFVARFLKGILHSLVLLPCIVHNPLILSCLLVREDEWACNATLSE